MAFRRGLRYHRLLLAQSYRFCERTRHSQSRRKDRRKFGDYDHATEDRDIGAAVLPEALGDVAGVGETATDGTEAELHATRAPVVATNTSRVTYRDVIRRQSGKRGALSI